MTKIKLVTGEIIACESVEIIGSVLHFTIKDKMTSEELAVLFKDKEKTSNIIFLTESGKVSGNREDLPLMLDRTLMKMVLSLYCLFSQEM